MAGKAILPVSKIISTREQAEALLAEIAADDAEVTRLKAELAVRLTAVRTDGEAQIKEVEKRIADKSASLESWGWSVKTVEFTEKRSQEWAHGTVGFRWGKRSLGLMSKVTWEKVVERLKGKWDQYIRIKEEVNKEKILNDTGAAESYLQPHDLSAMGVKVVQEDGFFIELNKR